jgi:hypothetical protein
MPAPGKNQQHKLLDEVRHFIRFCHYSIRTERANKKVNVPLVVMTREEVAAILSLLNSNPHLSLIVMGMSFKKSESNPPTLRHLG